MVKARLGPSHVPTQHTLEVSGAQTAVVTTKRPHEDSSWSRRGKEMEWGGLRAWTCLVHHSWFLQTFVTRPAGVPHPDLYNESPPGSPSSCPDPGLLLPDLGTCLGHCKPVCPGPRL